MGGDVSQHLILKRLAQLTPVGRGEIQPQGCLLFFSNT